MLNELIDKYYKIATGIVEDLVYLYIGKSHDTGKKKLYYGQPLIYKGLMGGIQHWLTVDAYSAHSLAKEVRVEELKEVSTILRAIADKIGCRYNEFKFNLEGCEIFVRFNNIRKDEANPTVAKLMIDGEVVGTLELLDFDDIDLLVGKVGQIFKDYESYQIGVSGGD